MPRRPEILTVAFEGPHRTGKGEQIGQLSEALSEAGIPYLVVKGDGTRPTADDYPIQLDEDWWQEMRGILFKPDSEISDWNKAAYRLARELIVARERILPQLANEMGSNQAVLILDRSVISRGVVDREHLLRGDEEILRDEMRPEGPSGVKKGRKVELTDVMPDLVINLVAAPEELLERLDPEDPKYAMRKQHIEQSSQLYAPERLAEVLPPELMERVVTIDANQDIDLIHQQVLSCVPLEVLSRE